MSLQSHDLIKLMYSGIAIGDVHGGAFAADIWYREMDKCFLTPTEKLEVLDFLILCGDLFHTRISVNSDHAKYMMLFINRLVKICSSKGTKLRIIKGTESHDNNQLGMIEALLTGNELDVKVIYTVETEQLFPDVKVLYIPEEYVDDRIAYYSEYFSETYDMIFGHGMVHEALHMAAKQESELTMPKAPVFKTDELLAICKGPIFFGHVHNNLIIKKRFHYTNSVSRWSFGEEEDKGYYIFSYSPQDASFKAKYIVNKDARKFETLEVDCKSGESPIDQVKHLVTLVDTLAGSRDYLRLEVNISPDYTESGLLTSTLKEVFDSYKKFKLKINNNSTLSKNRELQKKIKTILGNYSYLFDNKMKTNEKIIRFIKTKNNRDIPLERMNDYLSDNS